MACRNEGESEENHRPSVIASSSSLSETVFMAEQAHNGGMLKVRLCRVFLRDGHEVDRLRPVAERRHSAGPSHEIRVSSRLQAADDGSD